MEPERRTIAEDCDETPLWYVIAMILVILSPIWGIWLLEDTIDRPKVVYEKPAEGTWSAFGRCCCRCVKPPEPEPRPRAQPPEPGTLEDAFYQGMRPQIGDYGALDLTQRGVFDPKDCIRLESDRDRRGHHPCGGFDYTTWIDIIRWEAKHRLRPIAFYLQSRLTFYLDPDDPRRVSLRRRLRRENIP